MQNPNDHQAHEDPGQLCMLSYILLLMTIKLHTQLVALDAIFDSSPSSWLGTASTGLFMAKFMIPTYRSNDLALHWRWPFFRSCQDKRVWQHNHCSFRQSLSFFRMFWQFSRCGFVVASALIPGSVTRSCTHSCFRIPENSLCTALFSRIQEHFIHIYIYALSPMCAYSNATGMCPIFFSLDYSGSLLCDDPFKSQFP